MINTLWSLMILYINISNFQSVTSDITQLSINPSSKIMLIHDLTSTYDSLCQNKENQNKEMLEENFEDLLDKCYELKKKIKKDLSIIERMNSHLFLTFFEALYYAYHEPIWRYNYFQNNPEYLLRESNKFFTITNGSLAGLITAHKYYYKKALSFEIDSLDNLISLITTKLHTLR